MTSEVKAKPTASSVSAQSKAQNTDAPPAEDSASASDDTTPPTNETGSVSSQQLDRPSQHKASKPAESGYYPPTVGEAVVRMLHHMSRIFEDNSKADQIQRGLRIDRKRRQELQRKRLAMGHKPDDHEDQTFE